MDRVPELRVRPLVALAPRAGRYVLVWMTSQRRMSFNFTLERARGWAEHLGLPILILEPLRADYPHASLRFHRFVLDGMVENARACEQLAVAYRAYLEPRAGAGHDVLERFAVEAAVVVTDAWPGFFHERMRARAAQRLSALGVRLEAVDTCGLIPLRASPGPFTMAHSYRRFMQKLVLSGLPIMPVAEPFAGFRPRPLELPAALDAIEGVHSRQGLEPSLLDSLPIERSVGATRERGGHAAARTALERFVASKLTRYHEDRSDPDEACASGLSPWLHFGHIGMHEVLSHAITKTGWNPTSVDRAGVGHRDGFWNGAPGFDAFLDELITWREIGFHRCHHGAEIASFDDLPAWARATLGEHASDPRPARASLARLEAAESSDAVWNAAMRELRETGRIQNYVRMVWGKKFLEFFDDPREAFEACRMLNDRFALDGRDPNTMTNIGWVFGAYDRAWGPERPIFGKVRYMTSTATVKKLRMKAWLERWSGQPGLFDR